MLIKVEVTDAQFRNQLDNGIVDDEGGVGADWMCDYQLEIVKV